MIRATLETPQGPIGIIGINFQNWRRLKAGMPLDVDLKSITPPGKRMNRVVIHYAHTYEEVVQDLKAGGFPVPESMMADARQMDLRLARELRRQDEAQAQQ